MKDKTTQNQVPFDDASIDDDFYELNKPSDIIDDEEIDQKEYLVTLDELKKKYKLQDFEIINFEPQLEFLFSRGIAFIDDPLRNINTAINAKELRKIIVPTEKDAYFYKSLAIFIESCNDNIRIGNGLIEKGATKEEFLEAEGIINRLLDEFDPNWSTKQKLAYMHYRMGSLITYVPDIDCRKKYLNWHTINIWQSIINEQSVCNGISQLELNILSRLGIKSKVVTSDTHGYLIVKTEEGSIISDPTWDLSRTLYKREPKFFGISYDSIRKRDEENSHKLKSIPNDIIEISKEEVKEIYHSIGLTDCNKNYIASIEKFMENFCNREFASDAQKFDVFFREFIRRFPRECLHLEETRIMLRDCIYTLDVKKEDISTGYIYYKNDRFYRNPYLFCHININGLKDEIRMLDEENMRFKTVSFKELQSEYMVANKNNYFWNRFIGARTDER